ncbi:MAG: hypothetical protein RJA70_2283 [Pseudomonadota bacterium]|jgi:type III secretion HrpO family protein
MDLENLSHLTQHALWLAVVLSLPVVGVAALISLLVAVFQAATQVQDTTIAHLPRFIATAVALAVSGGWISQEIANFAAQVFGLG